MTLVNGAIQESVPVTDRGLLYGDGVFRTLLARRGEPLHWGAHYAKLEQDCSALALPFPDGPQLLGEVRAAATGLAEAAVRVTVTRGNGARGYAPPASCIPLRIVSAAAWQPRPLPPEGVTLHVCRLRLGHQPRLAGVKHLNRLENVLARAEWSDTSVPEGLLQDEEGCVIGGTMSNLFIVEDDGLLTPSLDQCGVAGVTRARVMTFAARQHIACRVERLTLQRVMEAREVFVVNSLIGLWPVARIGDRAWGRAKLAALLDAALRADDAALA